MAGLAGVLGIKELLALLDLRRRIAGERQGITIHRRTLIDGHDVVGQFVDFRVCQIELWHSPNTLRPGLIRRMVKLNLREWESNELTEYIMTVYKRRAVDSDSNADKGYRA